MARYRIIAHNRLACRDSMLANPNLSNDNSSVREQHQGTCEHCGNGFAYYLIHAGFSDSSYAYCDTCGETALLSYWRVKTFGIPELAHCFSYQEICTEWEPYLKSCDCGGSFKKGAAPRCPKCKEQLSPEVAAGYIERNAPGTKKGWHWQRNWHGLYCIVVDNKLVEDSFKVANP